MSNTTEPKKCSICFDTLKFINTPVANKGLLSDGTVICTKCFRAANNIDPFIAAKLKNYSTLDVRNLLANNTKVKNVDTKAALKGLAAIIVIIAILVVFFKSACSSDKNEKKTYTKFEALYDSRQFVEKILKSPGTAKWSPDEKNVTVINDTTFLINSWVDSQNGFGALVRSYYSCQMVYLPSSNKVQCQNLKIE